MDLSFTLLGVLSSVAISANSTDRILKSSIGVGRRRSRSVRMLKFRVLTILGLLIATAWSYGHAQSSLPPCPNSPTENMLVSFKWSDCIGSVTYTGVGLPEEKKWDRYVGEFKNGKADGQGTYTYADGHKHVGTFRQGENFGKGTVISSQGYTIVDGIWLDNFTVEEASGRWRHVTSGVGVDFFVLLQSIRVEGPFRRAWLMLASSNPDPDSRQLSIRQLSNFDCINERAQILSAIFYSGSFGAGTVLRSMREQTWDYVAPGTTIAGVMKYVCKYKL